MKLYISDLDGTLLNHKAKIDTFSKELLNRMINNGVNFTIATARSYYSAKPIIEEIDLALPIITQNGAFIIDPINGSYLVTHYFKSDQINYLKKIFMEIGEEILVYSHQNGEEKVTFLNNVKNKGLLRYIKQRKGDTRLTPCNDLEELFKGNVYYITIISPKNSVEKLDEFFNAKTGFSRNYQPDTYKTDEFWYEIFRKDVSKEKAIIELKKIIHADEIITFGDSINDLSMFNYSRRCYAVSNAIPEIKQKATSIIRSNEQGGVPVFLLLDNSIKRLYNKPDGFTDADKKRFIDSLHSTTVLQKGIGTLNEKMIHAVLKTFFSNNEIDKEIKIGKYYADIVGENGIIEIQTRNFNKLVPKLNCFLLNCHTTIVYPYHKKTKLIYINKDNGEILKTGRSVTHNNMNNFWLELYRIKQFINDPNLTICIAELSVEKLCYVDNDLKRKRNKLTTVHPNELVNLIYFDSANDYRALFPNIDETPFTVKQFKKIYPYADSSLVIKVLTALGIVDFIGKKGNEYLYKFLH